MTDLCAFGHYCDPEYNSKVSLPTDPQLCSYFDSLATQGSGQGAKNPTSGSESNRVSNLPPNRTNLDVLFSSQDENVNATTKQKCSVAPPYGNISPSQQLKNLKHVLYEEIKATFQPPVYTDDSARTQETREQYWRRLARYYIYASNKGQDVTPNITAEVHNAKDPFYIVDLGRVIEQMARWRKCLPMVRPHFAMKCNPSLPIMKVLFALGAGFDCASKKEIETVIENGLVSNPEVDIIFANPCKQIGDLIAAKKNNVLYVTFDNAEEVKKIAEHLPNAKAVLRIATNDKSARCAFSSKFGATMDAVPTLLDLAKECGVSINGVSFHVGSGNGDTSSYIQALKDSRAVFDMAKERGFHCTLLDIGGGYPGTDVNKTDTKSLENISFEEIAEAIRPVLVELFPSEIRIISEPGRFFTAASHSVLMNVFAVRKIPFPKSEEEALRAEYGTLLLENRKRLALACDAASEKFFEYQYYVNDGLYHTFNSIIFDSAHPELLLLNDSDGAEFDKKKSVADGTAQIKAPENTIVLADLLNQRRVCPPRPLQLSTIFGPTCDSKDCILKKKPFPEMKIGDWIISPDMGSYTTSSGCPFNGFATKRTVYICSTKL